MNVQIYLDVEHKERVGNSQQPTEDVTYEIHNESPSKCGSHKHVELNA